MNFKNTFCRSRIFRFFNLRCALESTTLLKHPDSLVPAGLVGKGETVRILYRSSRKWCLVRNDRGETGYLESRILTRDVIPPDSGPFYSLHAAAADKFNGGDALGCDYRTIDKSFVKKMPERFCCLYIGSISHASEHIDSYIDLARRTNINSFVIDIKEDGRPGFKAESMKKYVPLAYKMAPDNEEMYRETVKKLHRHGLWVIGRIVVFKDSDFAEEHPECGLWNESTNRVLDYYNSKWASAYSRYAWEYNAVLACESVQKFDFDEINLDYVRFPDRMAGIEDNVDLRNVYGESKVQAIQRFVKYAADCVHSVNACISVDVYGETANFGYTASYGQYWPAISNYCDVICGMPYPDHFTDGCYGIEKPWNHPFTIMYAWGKRAMARQAETPSPAVVRTWIKADKVMESVDPDGIDYDAENVEKEIRGLFAAGLAGGYSAWLSVPDISRYQSLAAAFSADCP